MKMWLQEKKEVRSQCVIRGNIFCGREAVPGREKRRNLRGYTLRIRKVVLGNNIRRGEI